MKDIKEMWRDKPSQFWTAVAMTFLFVYTLA